VGHGTSPKREMRCPGNMFRTMVIDQVSIATEVASPEEKNAGHLVPLPPDLPTEYYPFKRCQVPVGHPVFPLTFQRGEFLYGKDNKMICKFVRNYNSDF